MSKFTLFEEEQILKAAKAIEAARVREKGKRIAIIKRVQLSGLMELAKRGVVTFVKINGDMRVMEFEPRHIWDTKDLHTKYLTVYDFGVNDFRKVNLETVTEVEVEDVIYKVR
jgi:hypothetical protein